jgi:hypothetical protein
MLVLVCAAVLGGAMPGQAAGPANQKVEASLACEPGTVAPGAPIGCTLTVENKGGNAVNNTTITVTASGGSFASTTMPGSCSFSGAVLTCAVGKLNAVSTPGSTFTETHELLAPGSGSTVTQTVEGRYSSSTPNKRGNDTIAVTSENPLPTNLDASADFDGKFSDSAADSVQTDPISTGNPYSTGATLGTTGFAVGLTVKERAAGSGNPNCPPAGCFGGQVIDFDITPLGSSALPTSFTLTIKVYVGPGVKSDDLDVRHTTTLYGTNLVPMCADGLDPSGDCIVSKPVSSNTKIATITITGPGSGNGGWGVG